MSRTPRLLLAVLILAGVVGARWAAPASPAKDMAMAATLFLDALTPEQRARAALAFDDKAREDWHYVPRDNAGVSFKEMNDGQRIAARNLLRSALSSRGMNKVEEIMLLDAVLRDMAKGAGPRRDPLAYSIAVFGTPSADAAAQPWGWKIEGHHISLNFTGKADEATVTPAFLGANPGEVRQGDRAGVRVLAWEEDLARDLLASLTPEQRTAAVLSGQPPRDIVASPGRSLDVIDSSGLMVAGMTQPQRAMVERLLEEYAGNLRHELAEFEIKRMRETGVDRIRFAWIGSDRPGEGHYYRLVGPTFVIEYDNTQDGANHIHTVWRDRERDFGADLLKEHYEHGHHHSERDDAKRDAASRPGNP